jgi:hypothetical protein
VSGEAQMEEVTDEPPHLDRVCGIDIRKAGIVRQSGCHPIRDPSRRAADTRSFGTTKREVLALAACSGAGNTINFCLVLLRATRAKGLDLGGARIVQELPLLGRFNSDEGDFAFDVIVDAPSHAAWPPPTGRCGWPILNNLFRSVRRIAAGMS